MELNFKTRDKHRYALSQFIRLLDVRLVRRRFTNFTASRLPVLLTSFRFLKEVGNIMKDYKQIQATYIHTPFCVQKCLYCDFASYACRDANIMKEYAQSVCREIANGGAVELPINPKATIYFGGGFWLNALYVAMLWKYRRVKGRVASCAEMEIAKQLSTNRGSRGRCLQFSVAGMPRMIIPSIAAQESWKPMSHNEAGSVSSTTAALTFRISIWLRLSPHNCSSKASDVISAARMRLLGQPVIMA